MATFFTGILAAFFGYLIAVRKFKKEKIWQEKYSAYQEILISLETMLLWANEIYAQNSMLPTIGAGDELNFSQARRAISKQACIGSLLVSKEVISILNDIERELWDEDFRADDERSGEMDINNYMAQHAENVRKILGPKIDQIIELARQDLG